MPANRRYQSRRRRGASSSSGNSENKTTNQNGGGRRNNRSKADFRFQLHDPQQKGTYTFERIHEAIVLKVQKEFKESRLISKT